jgi:hypothetical protein
MSDASDAFENGLALLFFNATTWANVAQNASSGPVTDWSLSLHTSSPGEAGAQNTNEITYTNYARKTVVRTNVGFTVAAAVTSLAANQDFVTGAGGSGTATHMGLGTLSSGAGVLKLYGAITPNIVTGNGITPRLTTSTTFTIA